VARDLTAPLLDRARAVEGEVTKALQTSQAAGKPTIARSLYKGFPRLRLKGSIPYPAYDCELRFTLRFDMRSGRAYPVRTCAYELQRQEEMLFMVDNCEHHSGFSTEYHRIERLMDDRFVAFASPQETPTPTIGSIIAEVEGKWLARVSAALARGDLK